MKPFVAPYIVDICRSRLADLMSSSLFGFIQTKVKFTPTGDGNYRYILWKTMRGNFGQQITLAEVTGMLQQRDAATTLVSGSSKMGRFYKTMFIFYGFVLIIALISFLTSQKVSYLIYMVLVLGIAGVGWLLTYYWRNQLEMKVEQTLMIHVNKKGFASSKPLQRSNGD